MESRKQEQEKLPYMHEMKDKKVLGGGLEVGTGGSPRV